MSVVAITGMSDRQTTNTARVAFVSIIRDYEQFISIDLRTISPRPTYLVSSTQTEDADVHVTNEAEPGTT
jgi:hypothetical protein